MKHLLTTIALTSAAALAAVGPALAQFMSDVALECVDAIEAGDAETVKSIAEDVRAWGAIAADSNTKQKIISNGEQCLEAATGERWLYWNEGSRFIPEADREVIQTEEAARLKAEAEESAARLKAEAEERAARLKAEAEERAARLKAKERLDCEIYLAEIEVTALQGEKARFQERRTMEVIFSTQAVCIDLYEEDPGKALLEPVCNDLLKQIGLPDTDFPYDEAKLRSAEIALMALLIKSKIASNPTSETMGDLRTQQCEALLAEQ